MERHLDQNRNPRSLGLRLEKHRAGAASDLFGDFTLGDSLQERKLEWLEAARARLRRQRKVAGARMDHEILAVGRGRELMETAVVIPNPRVEGELVIAADL